MCHEPIRGVAIFLEEVTTTAPSSTDEESPSSRDQIGRLTGEVIRTVRDSIHQAFMDWSPRLMLAMYSCEIQASSNCLPFLPFPLYHPTPQLTNPPRSRSPRPRLLSPLPPPRPHPHRIPQRRHPLLQHPQPPARRRILRLQRRDPQTHVRRRAAAARVFRVRAAG